MLLWGSVLCVVISYYSIEASGDNFLPDHFEFWLSILPLLIGYVLIFKFMKRNHMI